MDTSRFGPSPVCSSMMVSVRRPSALPVPSLRRCLAVRSSRLSLPTSRYVDPGCSAGRSPPGSASTFSILVQAHTGTASRNSTHNTSRATTQRTGWRRREERDRPPPVERGVVGPSRRGGACRRAGCVAGASSRRRPRSLGRFSVGMTRVGSGSLGAWPPDPSPLRSVPYSQS